MAPTEDGAGAAEEGFVDVGPAVAAVEEENEPFQVTARFVQAAGEMADELCQ